MGSAKGMPHYTFAKESVSCGLFGIINELVDQNNVTRRIFLLQRTDCAGTNDPGNSKLFHRPDIGAMV